MATNVKIKTYTINKNSISISAKPGENLQLTVNTKMKLNPPKNTGKDNTAHLEFELAVDSVNNTSFCVEMSGDFIFEFENIPTNYSGEIEQNCGHIAINKFSETLDETLKLMHYPTLNLANHLTEINLIK